MSNGSSNLKAQWKKLQKEYQDDDAMRDSIMDMASTEKGQEILEQARKKWLDQGFKTAPFDFIFEGDKG